MNFFAQQLTELYLDLENRTGITGWADFVNYLTRGLIMALAIYLLLTFLGRYWRSLNKRDIAAKVVTSLAMPLALLVFLYMASFSVDMLKKMDGMLWMRIQQTFFPCLYSLTIALFLFRFVDILALVVRPAIANNSSRVDQHLIDLMRRVLKGFFLLVVFMILLDNLGIKVMALITGLGFLGAAIALAAQNTLANIFGAISILADRIFKVGDRVQFDQYDGFIIAMGLRSVKLAALTGEVITIPNKEVADRLVRNFTSHGASLMIIKIGLTYSMSRPKIEEAMKILGEIFTAHPEIQSHETSFKEFGTYTLDLCSRIMVPYKDEADYYRVLTGLNLEIKERFDRAGIDFAFPTQTIHLPDSVSTAPKGTIPKA